MAAKIERDGFFLRRLDNFLAVKQLGGRRLAEKKAGTEKIRRNMQAPGSGLTVAVLRFESHFMLSASAHERLNFGCVVV